MQGYATWIQRRGVSPIVAFRRLFEVEIEELYRVGPTDFEPLLIADDSARVIPGRGVFHLFERIIRREIDFVLVEHVERAAECRIVEIAARGDMEVISEVIAQR